MHSEDRRRCSRAAGPWGRLAVLLILGIISGTARAQAGEDTTPWAPGIRRAEEALTRREFSAALRAANEAHEAATRTTGWEGLVEVAGTYRHIGEVTGLRQSFDTKAREIYGRGLFRARQQGSVEGVLRVAEGYLTLGDITAATQCVRVAERLAGRDPEARADVRAFAARLADAGTAATAARP
jgi:hypothetical protein